MLYKMLVKYLEADGFILNQYDPCVANKMVNGHHMIVAWNTNKLKVLHKDPFEITMFATYLGSIYGDSIEVCRGNLHDYLIMDLYYYKKGYIQL